MCVCVCACLYIIAILVLKLKDEEIFMCGPMLNFDELATPTVVTGDEELVK